MMSPASNDPGWARLEGVEGSLVMFAVFAYPGDYPRHWVVRRSFVLPTGELIADVVPRLALDLESAREHIPPGLYCQPRMTGDEPHIIEVWF
jgi:hypothetical protein